MIEAFAILSLLLLSITNGKIEKILMFLMATVTAYILYSSIEEIALLICLLPIPHIYKSNKNIIKRRNRTSIFWRRCYLILTVVLFTSLIEKGFVLQNKVLFTSMLQVEYYLLPLVIIFITFYIIRLGRKS